MPITVTAAVIIDENKRLFLAKRKKNDTLGGFWEFPGGKLEPGEKPDKCLEREIKEELDFEIRAKAPFNFSYFEYGNKKILLLAYLCEYISGEARALECDDFGFFEKNDIASSKMPIAPADVALLNEIIERGFIK
ncbi:MAG TPA: (deoxy)nucleoside triphosphate pyrophosphohydrolase [Candidatus Wallbacteria bacterium]|nr:(deoxy)nucleoside triphosphate pyrophosphohydrolase [Candidatus Wallbacteria bacterium]